MSEGLNGRIQINGGEWKDAQIELDFYPQEVIIEEPKFTHEWAHLKQWSTGSKIEGTLTSYGVELFRGIFEELGGVDPRMFLVSQETMWRIEYAKQGKHYPSPRKRKSKAWRERMRKKMEQG